MIKAILFDLDGVLLDACDWHYEALNRALREVSQTTIERDEHEEKFNGLPTSVKLEMLRRLGRVEVEDFDKIKELKQKYFLEVLEEKDTYQGHTIRTAVGPRPRTGKLHNERLVSLLKLLRSNNIRIACVTNSIKQTTWKMLEKLGVANSMETVITNEDIDHPKPHPEGYWKAMALFGVMPNETLIIEDSPKGQAAAKASGAHLMRVASSADLNWLSLAAAVSTVNTHESTNSDGGGGK
jgi:HAD superfamily hydrolase (TIGR01509 family)